MNISVLFVTIWVITESPWPFRAEYVWFSSKWSAFYNHFTQEEMQFQEHLSIVSKDLAAGEMKSFLMHVLQLSFTWEAIVFPNFFPSELFLTFDHVLAVRPVTVKLDVTVGRTMTAGHWCRDFYKTEMTDVLSNHRGWHREKCLFWSFNRCENLSVIYICEHEGPKGMKCKMWFLAGFWGFWD